MNRGSIANGFHPKVSAPFLYEASLQKRPPRTESKCISKFTHTRRRKNVTDYRWCADRKDLGSLGKRLKFGRNRAHA